MPKRHRDESPPPEIPEHKLLGMIDEGGYGQVWLVENPLGQRRAVKVVRRGWFRDERNYEREYRGIERFEPISRSHPALLNILQLGRNDGAQFYYVMELADNALGQAGYQPDTLRHRIDTNGRLPISDCAALGIRLANGLTHLHGRGLVHRDIKPSNILYIGGQPTLGDIGTVALTAEARSLVGTHGYIPLDGPGTPAADLFGLGKTLYETFTGKDRFDYPELPQALIAVEDTQQISRFNDILLHACAASRRSRYSAATDLAADLERLQAGQAPTHAKHPRRHWAIATTTALISSAITWAAWPSGRKEEESSDSPWLGMKLLSRTKVEDLGVQPPFDPHLTLNENHLAIQELTKNGVVQIFEIGESGKLSLFKSIPSPEKTYDWPAFGDSIFMDGNLLGIGSSHTWSEKPHDGKFYLFDLKTGTKKTSFNPGPKKAQFFAAGSTYSNGVLAAGEGGNCDFGTVAAFTFYRVDGFVPTQLFRYEHPGKCSRYTQMTSSGDFFVAQVDDFQSRHLFVWKAVRDSKGSVTGVESFAEYEEEMGPTAVAAWPDSTTATNEKLVAVGLPSATVATIESGAVIIFKINRKGSLTKLHQLVPPVGTPKIKFGSCVAFAGDTLFVGSSHAPNGTPGKGKVYVYQFKNNEPPMKPHSFWPPNCQDGETFGETIAVSKTHTAIASEREVVYFHKLNY